MYEQISKNHKFLGKINIERGRFKYFPKKKNKIYILIEN